MSWCGDSTAPPGHFLVGRATVAPLLRKARGNRPKSPLVPAHRRYLGELVPEMEAICGGGLISPARADRPKCRGFDAKRLMGFEPTTFRMAIRPDSNPDRSEYVHLQGLPSCAERPRSGCVRRRDSGSSLYLVDDLHLWPEPVEDLAETLPDRILEARRRGREHHPVGRQQVR